MKARLLKITITLEILPNGKEHNFMKRAIIFRKKLLKININIETVRAKSAQGSVL